MTTIQHDAPTLPVALDYACGHCGEALTMTVTSTDGIYAFTCPTHGPAADVLLVRLWG